MRKHLMLALALLVPSAAATAADTNSDSSFIKSAAEGGIAEVEMGRLAQQKAASTAVKDFGMMMVTDHTASNEKLKTLASAKSVDLPDSPSLMQKATRTKLEMMKGTSFDKSYIKDMISDHQQDIKAFETEATSGKDSDTRAFALATLPTLKAHLKKILAISTAQGVNP